MRAVDKVDADMLLKHVKRELEYAIRHRTDVQMFMKGILTDVFYDAVVRLNAGHFNVHSTCDTYVPLSEGQVVRKEGA